MVVVVGLGVGGRTRIGALRVSTIVGTRPPSCVVVHGDPASPSTLKPSSKQKPAFPFVDVLLPRKTLNSRAEPLTGPPRRLACAPLKTPPWWPSQAR